MKKIDLRVLKNDITDDITDDFNIVLLAVQQNPFNLQWASQRLKNNEKIMTLFLKKDKYSFKFFGEKFKQDKIFILECLEINVGCFTFLKDDNLLKKDKDILITVLSKNSKFYEQIPLELKKDEDILYTFKNYYIQELKKYSIDIYIDSQEPLSILSELNQKLNNIISKSDIALLKYNKYELNNQNFEKNETPFEILMNNVNLLIQKTKSLNLKNKENEKKKINEYTISH